MALLLAGYSMPLAAQDLAQSDDLTIAARQFGTREDVRYVSLSPSGDKIAFISSGPGHSEVLNVVDLDGAATPKPIAANSDQAEDLDWCVWATDDRLVCQVSGLSNDVRGLLAGYDRLFAVDADGGNVKELSKRETINALRAMRNGGDILALDVGGEPGKILMSRQYVPQRNDTSRIARDERGLGVELVDVTTARRRQFERPDEDAVQFVTDEIGRVRVKVRLPRDSLGLIKGETNYYYRTSESDTWQSFERLTIDGKPVLNFSPLSVNSRLNVAYGYINKDGYRAMAEFALDGSGLGKVLLARGDVDIGSLIQIGRQRRVVGVSYATEKRQIVYFDPELVQLTGDLAKALSGQLAISIVGASANENRLLIIASSDTQPGVVYLYDKAARQLEPLLGIRNLIADRQLGTMRPVTYPASDGTMIPGYLTLPPGSDGMNLPAIVMPHGGPRARDTWGFDWLVQFFVARGFAVLQPNFRGSSGYGEAWYGRNGLQAWDVAIGDVNDGGRWLVSEGIARPDQMAIVGWSYGGYAALQWQVVAPDLFKAVAAIAPVTDLEFLRDDARGYSNFRAIEQLLGQGPHIAAGSPRLHADKFAAPVALFHGTRDFNVNVRHSQEMGKALQLAGKSVVYHEYPDLQHDLGDSIVRAKMLQEIGQFLDDELGRN